MVRDFVNAITDEVNERREEIEKSSVKYVEGQLKAAEAEILEDVFLEINRKSAEIKASVGKEVSEKASEYRQSVLSHRSALADEVYDKAEKKITEFTKSEKYEAFLINSAKNATEFFGQRKRYFCSQGRFILRRKNRKGYRLRRSGRRRNCYRRNYGKTRQHYSRRHP